MIQFIFLVVFVIFILLNVILGLVASRAKRKKAERKESAQDASSPADGELPGDGSGYERGAGDTSFLQPQTAESVVVSMDYEEPAVIPEERAEVVDDTAPLPGMDRTVPRPSEEIPAAGDGASAKSAEIYPERVHELRRDYEQRKDRPKTLVDIHEKTIDMKAVLEKARPGYGDAGRTDISGMRTPEPPEPARSAWETIGSLPYLQRAVLLSEILGPPKAESEGTHSY